MITAGHLIELLQQLPTDARLVAYEGEDIGLRIIVEDGERMGYGWIAARPTGLQGGQALDIRYCED